MRNNKCFSSCLFERAISEALFFLSHRKGHLSFFAPSSKNVIGPQTFPFSPPTIITRAHERTHIPCQRETCARSFAYTSRGRRRNLCLPPQACHDSFLLPVVYDATPDALAGKRIDAFPAYARSERNILAGRQFLERG